MPHRGSNIELAMVARVTGKPACEGKRAGLTNSLPCGAMDEGKMPSPHSLSPCHLRHMGELTPPLAGYSIDRVGSVLRMGSTTELTSMVWT